MYILYHSLFPKLGITSHFLKALKNFLNEKAEKSAVCKSYLLIAYFQTKVVNLMKGGEKAREKKTNVVPVAISQILQSL